HAAWPWHFLYFFPLPHGHGSLRPTFGSSRRTVLITSSPPVRAGTGPCRDEAGPGDGIVAAAAREVPNADAASALFIVMGVARRATGRGAAGAWSLTTGRSHMM